MDDERDSSRTPVKPDSLQSDTGTTSSPHVASGYATTEENLRYHTDPVSFTCPNCHRDIVTEVTAERHCCSCSNATLCLFITCCGFYKVLHSDDGILGSEHISFKKNYQAATRRRICLAGLTNTFTCTEYWGWDRMCKNEGTEYKHKCPLCKIQLASWTEA